jgi:hypothetical protein
MVMVINLPPISALPSRVDLLAHGASAPNRLDRFQAPCEAAKTSTRPFQEVNISILFKL